MYSEYKTFEEAREELPNALLEKPYKRIYLKYDERWKKTGKKVFKYGAPHIISTHCPDINENGMDFRSRLNIVFLANPGGGKSDIMKEVEYLSINEHPVNKNTDADLQKSIASKYGGYRSGNLIINDLKNIMKQEQLKSLEEMIEEGRVQRSTDDYSIDEEVDVCLFGGGVPFEIKDTIVGGFIFRVIPVEVSHDIQEQKEVGEHIRKKLAGDSVCYECDDEIPEDDEAEYYNGNAFCSSECVEQFEKGRMNERLNEFDRQDIREYYRVLKSAINGDFKDFEAIDGYKFSPQQLKDIEEKWSEGLRDFNARSVSAYWFRQKFDGYRLAAVLSILNLPNREVVEERGKRKVVVDDIDVEYAKNLMYQGIGLIMDQISDARASEKLSQADEVGGEELDAAVRQVDAIE